ncbi:hypothetical protein RB597_010279 [Gaeumannomyces tritici]
MQPPSTPTKNHSIDVVRATIKDVFQALNAEVGLELAAPDPTASPSRRRLWADQNDYHSRCDRIWTEFHYQFHQGDIDAVLRDFHVQAKQTFSGWVRKPRADPKTLPASAKPYRARDNAEIAALQELLRDVLVERRKSMPRRLFKKTHSDGAVLEKDGGANPNPTAFTKFAAPARPQTKRSSDEGIAEESCEKPKNTGKVGGAVAKVSLERASGDLDNVMVRSSFVSKSTSFAGPSRARASAAQLQYQSPPAAARRPSPPKRETSNFLNYDASANTSSVPLASAYTSVSAVFSVSGDDDVPMNTQMTVDASSQELKGVLPSSSQRLRAPPPPAIEPPASSFQFSGAEPTSDELEVLWGAENEATVKPPTTPSAKIDPQDTSSSSPSPESSATYSPWSGSMVDLLAEQPHMVPETAAEPAPGPAPEPVTEPVQQAPRKRETLQDRLDLVWPKFPDWLREAPLAVAWEVCRVALHCGVDLSQIKGMTYGSSWVEQKKLWSVLHQRHEFKARPFPEQSPPLVWAAALNSFKSRGQNVVLTASMDFSTASTGPLFVLKMLPLKFDQPYRLSRRFGSDRFLEILYRSPNSGNAPTALKGEAGEDARGTTNRWLARGQHWLVGRQWVSFYTKDAEYKQPTIDVRLGPEPPKVYKDRTYFFAVDGHNFQTPPPRHILPPKDQEITRRTRLSVHKMLDWLLQLGENMDQPYLKLFARIALGTSTCFSRTFSVEMEPAADILSQA